MTRTADASKVSGADFARSLGLKIRTPEQKEAEWRAMCERAADAIENGLEDLVSPPLLRDARRIVAEREQQFPYDRQREDICPQNKRPRWAA